MSTVNMLLTLVILCSSVYSGTAFTPGTQAPPSTPCRGAALSDCDGIERPEPRCDPMTCAWGSVSHTYNCPAALTCDMDCYGCGAGDDTLLCADMLSLYKSCNDYPVYMSTCSKTMGVGVILYQYICLTQANAQEAVTCHELCCCEKYKAGPVVTGPTVTPITPLPPYCTRDDVINWGFPDTVEADDKRAYCPGYDIPEWN